MQWTDYKMDTQYPAKDKERSIEQYMLTRIRMKHLKLKCKAKYRPIEEVPYLSNSCGYPKECGIEIECTDAKGEINNKSTSQSAEGYTQEQIRHMLGVDHTTIVERALRNKEGMRRMTMASCVGQE